MRRGEAHPFSFFRTHFFPKKTQRQFTAFSIALSGEGAEGGRFFFFSRDTKASKHMLDGILFWSLCGHGLFFLVGGDSFPSRSKFSFHRRELGHQLDAE